MAKLSLWLITMDRERPFGFLDDRLVCGDSLLGLVSVDQLESLHVDPAAGRRLNAGTLDFADGWRPRLAAAADLRRRITAAPVVTIRDVEHKARLLAEAERTLWHADRSRRRDHRGRPRGREAARASSATPSSSGSRSSVGNAVEGDPTDLADWAERDPPG